jgi:hypothetical protein
MNRTMDKKERVNWVVEMIIFEALCLSGLDKVISFFIEDSHKIRKL